MEKPVGHMLQLWNRIRCLRIPRYIALHQHCPAWELQLVRLSRTNAWKPIHPVIPGQQTTSKKHINESSVVTCTTWKVISPVSESRGDSSKRSSDYYLIGNDRKLEGIFCWTKWDRVFGRKTASHGTWLCFFRYIVQQGTQIDRDEPWRIGGRGSSETLLQ